MTYDKGDQMKSISCKRECKSGMHVIHQGKPREYAQVRTTYSDNYMIVALVIYEHREELK